MKAFSMDFDCAWRFLRWADLRVFVCLCLCVRSPVRVSVSTSAGVAEDH
jgi:hypothetical protein